MKKRKVLLTGAGRGLWLAIAKKRSSEYNLIPHASKPEAFNSIVQDYQHDH